LKIEGQPRVGKLDEPAAGEVFTRDQNLGDASFFGQTPDRFDAAQIRGRKSFAVEPFRV
jgi:hypothetical protein